MQKESRVGNVRIRNLRKSINCGKQYQQEVADRRRLRIPQNEKATWLCLGFMRWKQAWKGDLSKWVLLTRPQQPFWSSSHLNQVGMMVARFSRDTYTVGCCCHLGDSGDLELGLCEL